MASSACDEPVLFSVVDAVATLTLNRPDKRNALSRDMMHLMHQHLQAVEQNPAVKVVILTGQGPHFSAGADLNEMRAAAKQPYGENLADAHLLADLMYRLYTLPKPTLGLIQGAVYGGGVGLVACLDIALATTSAEFCLSEVKLGLIPAVISPYLIQAMGARNARRYCLSAELISAELAQRLGLVHEVLPSKQALHMRRDTLIKQLCGNGMHAMHQVKQLLRTISTQSIDADLKAYTAEVIATLRTQPEAQEGLQAFLEKRKPNWVV